MQKRKWFGAPLGLLGILLAGCGPRVERGEVDGTVRHQGKPLAKAKLELIAESGWKRELKTD